MNKSGMRLSLTLLLLMYMVIQVLGLVLNGLSDDNEYYEFISSLVMRNKQITRKRNELVNNIANSSINDISPQQSIEADTFKSVNQTVGMRYVSSSDGSSSQEITGNGVKRADSANSSMSNIHDNNPSQMVFEKSSPINQSHYPNNSDYDNVTRSTFSEKPISKSSVPSDPPPLLSLVNNTRQPILKGIVDPSSQKLRDPDMPIPKTVHYYNWGDINAGRFKI